MSPPSSTGLPARIRNHPTAMVPRPGAILRWFVERLFGRVEVPSATVEAIRALGRDASIVYVGRNVSVLEYLYLTFVCLRQQLPLARFAGGLWPFAWMSLFLRPLTQIVSTLMALLRVKHDEDLTAFEAAIESGGAATLYLRAPPSVLGGTPRGFRLPYFDKLVAVAKQRPVVVVPFSFVWGSPALREKRRSATLIDRLLGDTEAPGTLRMAWNFFVNRGHAQLLIGEPLALTPWLASEAAAGATDDVLPRRLRWQIGGRIEAEVRVQLGPPRKSARRLVQETLRTRKLVAEALTIAKEENVSPAAIEKRARAMVKEIAANPQPWTFAVGERFLRWVFSRIFDGIEVDAAGLERVREAARKGPLILVPSHKSHVDYLVLSFVFLMNDLVPPYIAAGANLSFWPLGWFFRQGGAFFLRRTFRGDRLYASVFRAYLRRIIREGHNVEFFIEGGRSRNGKLLPPKLGMVGMVVEAALEDDGQRARTAQVVPISIGYEDVIEEKSYAKELAGGEKKKEDVRGLLGATGVLLSKYGQINIQFDEPIPLGPALREAGAIVSWDSDDSAVVAGDEGARRLATQRIGHRIVYGINRVTALTPPALVAAALLSPGKRGVERQELLRNAAFLFDEVRRQGGRMSRALVDEGHDDEEGDDSLSIEAIDRALDLFEKKGHISVRTAGAGKGGELGRRRDDEIYVLPDERRPYLAIPRNNAVHFFVADSLVCLAFITATAATQGEVASATLSQNTLELSRLFKFEFTYKVGERFPVLFAETLERLRVAGVLQETPEHHVVAQNRERAQLLAGLVQDLIETYWLVSATLIDAQSTSDKDLLSRMQERGDKLFFTGDIKRREACSKQGYQNALSSLKELGYVTERDKKTKAEPSLSAVKATLERYLNRVEAR